MSNNLTGKGCSCEFDKKEIWQEINSIWNEIKSMKKRLNVLIRDKEDEDEILKRMSQEFQSECRLD